MKSDLGVDGGLLAVDDSAPPVLSRGVNPSR